MSNITQDDIKKIARLAKIEIANEEFEYYSNQLTNITGWVETLKDVDTDGVEPMTSVFDNPLPMSQDLIEDGNITKDILQNAKSEKYD